MSLISIKKPLVILVSQLEKERDFNRFSKNKVFMAPIPMKLELLKNLRPVSFLIFIFCYKEWRMFVESLLFRRTMQSFFCYVSKEQQCFPFPSQYLYKVSISLAEAAKRNEASHFLWKEKKKQSSFFNLKEHIVKRVVLFLCKHFFVFDPLILQELSKNTLVD